MSTSVVYNGASFTVPAVADASWGQNVTNYLIALASGSLQKTGGAFTLGAEVDFGATYGLKAPYFKSKAATIAATGVVRLSNTDLVAWRNNANAGDLALGVSTADRLQFQTVNIPTVSSTDTLTNKTLTSPAVTGLTGTLSSPTIATPAITGSTDWTNTTAPATPSAGHTALYPSSVDGKFHFINSSGTDSVLGASGSGELNLVGNPSDAVGWTSGTGYTVATTTTAGDLPLSSMVATAIKITSGTGTSAEATLAQTNSYSFTTPASYAVKTKVEFWLRPGTNFIASEWTVSVYAGSTRQSLTTDASGVTYIPNLNGKFTTYFDAAASTAYTVRFTRVNNVGANAGVLNVTNVIVGPGIQPQGAVVGPWQSYTPTLTGFGTVSGLTASWRQVGSSVKGIVSFTAGTTTATTAAITLPNSYSPSTAVLGSTATPVQVGTWNRGTASATQVKTGLMVVNVGNGNTLFFTYNDYTTSASPVTLQQASNIIGTGQYVELEFDVPVNELAGSGTVNLAQNDVQYYYGTGGTWGTSGTITTAQGPGGVLGGTTTPAGTAFQWTMVPATPIPSGAVAVLHTSPDGIHWTAGYNAVTPHNTAALSFDGTNNIGAGASITSAGNIRVDFGKYSDAGSSTWTGTWYWRVAVGLPGQAVGFGIVNPGTSSGLVAAAGLPGNTTGNAIAAGYVGEIKTSTSPQVVYSAPATWENLATLTMTAGLWLVSGMIQNSYNSSSSGADLQLAISGYSSTTVTDHTVFLNWWQGVAAPTNASDYSLTAMPVFVRSDGTNLYIGSSTIAGQTLYLKSRVTYTGTAHKRAGTITAARIA